MKKNLITISICVVFLFLGISFAKAETPSSAKASRRTAQAILISKKISELKIKCQSKMIPCGEQLVALVQINDVYMGECAPIYTYCDGSFIEMLLLEAAARYELCIAIAGYTSQNIDRNINREKPVKIQGRQRGTRIV